VTGNEVVGVAAFSSGDPRDVIGGAPLPAAMADGALEIVAVPAHPGSPASGEFFLEARRLPGNRSVLPVFSTVGKLVEALGQAQPWAVLPLEQARQMASASGIDVIALDPVMSPETWKWRPDNLDEFERGRRSNG
jgi:hypothetical protein